MKIKTQIYSLVAAVIVPSVAVIAFLGVAWYSADRDKALATAAGLAVNAADNVLNIVLKAEATLALLAAQPGVRALDPENCDPSLKLLRDIDPAHANLTVIPPDGRAVCSAVPLPAAGPIPVLDTEWFQRAKASDHMIASKQYIGRITGKQVSVLAYPAREDDGSLLAVITMPLDLARLKPVSDLSDFPLGTTVTIVDGDGRVIARQPDSSWAGRNIADHSIVQTALSGGAGTKIGKNVDGALVLFAYMPIPKVDWIAIAAIPARTAFAQSRAKIEQAILVIAVMLAAVLIVAVTMVRRMTRPIDQIAATARAVAAGDLNIRVPVPQQDELAVAARQFNAMLDIRVHSEQYFRDLLDAAPDATIISDSLGVIRHANRQAEKMFGYSIAELVGQAVEILIPNAAHDAHVAHRAAFMREPTSRTMGEGREFKARRKDGTTFAVEVAIGPLQTPDGVLISSSVRDVTERNITQRRIIKLYHMYSMLSRTNHAITHLTDRQRLLDDICAIAVENSSIVLAWIGFVDPENHAVRPVSIAGPAASYLGQNFQIPSIDLPNPERQGPIHVVIRRNRPDIRSDLMNDPWFAFRREAARPYGLRSCAAFPLTQNGQPIGVINLYASEPNYFDDREIQQLIGEMASDVSYALDALVRDAAHRDTEHRFRQIAENIREVFWLTDADTGKVLYISPAFEAIWGRKCDELYASQSIWVESVHDDDRTRVLEAIQAGAASGGYDEEYRIVRPDGGVRWIHDRAFPVHVPTGRTRRIAGIAEDITQRKKILDDVTESERRLESVLTSITDACYVTDADFRFTYLNPQAEILLRRSRDELIGVGIWDAFPEAVASPFDANLRMSMDRRVPSHLVEYYAPLEAWLEVHVYPTDDGISVFFRDVTERKKQEEELEFLAQYDTLTRLPNRSLFRDRLQQAMVRARRDQRNLGLMFLDLNRFKEVNDTLGHGIGDKVLEGVAERLRLHLREADTIARLGGDEFTIIVEDLENAGQAAAVARKVQTALAEPLIVGENEIYVAASIGIVLYPHEDDDLDGLVRKADIAMYQAKLVGGSAYQMYTGAQAKAPDAIAVESKLRRALERNEFELYYQPQVDIASGRTIGAEALLRWTSPDLGSVSPGRFIPLAEETGLIVEIGEWVMRTAANQAVAWRRAGYGPLPISVNMSARQFRRKDIAKTVSDILDEAGLDPALFEIEITEGTIMHHTDQAVTTLNELNEMGVELAIDDFGTGYSSLAYLRRFPLDKLKIDRAFVRDIETNSADATIVRAIVALADGLNLKVVAEGVETEGQMQRLKSYGVKSIQGYFYSRPLPAAEFEKLLRGRSVGE